MKKQVVTRGLIGLPMGIAIGYIITIILSMISGQGNYSPCVPSLVQQMGNEINAIILQTILCAVLGAGFGANSIIWEIDNWSILKQSLVYFAISALLMFPIAYICHWMKYTFSSFITYFAIYTFIFVIVWLVQYGIYRVTINGINKEISK